MVSALIPCLTNHDLIGNLKLLFFHGLACLYYFFAIVPISVVASFKKIKALIGSHAQLAEVLRCSINLVSFLHLLAVFTSLSPPLKELTLCASPVQNFATISVLQMFSF